MINASSCTVELWMHLGDVLGGLLSSQELEVNIVYWRRQRAQWEDEARSSYWFWLGEYSSYVITVVNLVMWWHHKVCNCKYTSSVCSKHVLSKDEGCPNPCSSKNSKMVKFHLHFLWNPIWLCYHSSIVSSFIDHRTNLKKCAKPCRYCRPVFLLRMILRLIKPG